VVGEEILFGWMRITDGAIPNRTLQASDQRQMAVAEKTTRRCRKALSKNRKDAQDVCRDQNQKTDGECAKVQLTQTTANPRS